MEGMEVNRNEEIRQVAYRIWQEEGRPDGRHHEHWLRAEMIWEEINRPQSKRKPSMSRGRRKAGQTQAAKREL